MPYIINFADNSISAEISQMSNRRLYEEVLTPNIQVKLIYNHRVLPFTDDVTLIENDIYLITDKDEFRLEVEETGEIYTYSPDPYVTVKEFCEIVRRTLNLEVYYGMLKSKFQILNSADTEPLFHYGTEFKVHTKILDSTYCNECSESVVSLSETENFQCISLTSWQNKPKN